MIPSSQEQRTMTTMMMTTMSQTPRPIPSLPLVTMRPFPLPATIPLHDPSPSSTPARRSGSVRPSPRWTRPLRRVGGRRGRSPRASAPRCASGGRPLPHQAMPPQARPLMTGRPACMGSSPYHEPRVPSLLRRQPARLRDRRARGPQIRGDSWPGRTLPGRIRGLGTGAPGFRPT